MFKNVMFTPSMGFGVVASSHLSAVVGPNAGLHAQAQTHDHAADPAAPTGQAAQPGMAGTHQKMMADMKAADEKLAALVTVMNAAKGEARVEALAKVVNELVVQQNAMHEHMGMMEMMMSSGGGMMMKK